MLQALHQKYGVWCPGSSGALLMWSFAFKDKYFPELIQMEGFVRSGLTWPETTREKTEAGPPYGELFVYSSPKHLAFPAARTSASTKRVREYPSASLLVGAPTRGRPEGARES